MASSARWFVAGFSAAILIVVIGAFLFIELAGVSMATKSPPLPLEASVAKLALHASFAGSEKQRDPLPLTEANIAAGAKLYSQLCASCHSAPGYPPADVAKGEFPPPPQLLEKGQMVTDDPEGITYWKITNGIRLSGMPEFGSALSYTERWQLAMLLAHANKLPPAAISVLEPK
jgi:mono/diheme cytochrome c family protein